MTRKAKVTWSYIVSIEVNGRESSEWSGHGLTEAQALNRVKQICEDQPERRKWWQFWRDKITVSVDIWQAVT